MIDFAAVIRHFGAEAVRLQLDEVETLDNPALQAIRKRDSPRRDEILLNWFYTYRVFQGISTPKRRAITLAVLRWADRRDLQARLTTADALEEAHAELMALCSRADGRNRDFTSLASKALWLCYPKDVPLFDSFVQRALWVIAKLEDSKVRIPTDSTEYCRFVHTWKSLYKRYATVLDTIDTQGYPYRVRIFDKVLWIIGTRQYEYPIEGSKR